MRQSGLSGGISVFFKSYLELEVLHELCECTLFIEICTVKLFAQGTCYYILGIYRPHSGTTDEFLEALAAILSKIPSSNRANIVIFGDINIDLLLQSNNRTQRLYHFMRSNFLAPIISNPTRYPPNPNETPSLLNHIWINFIVSSLNCGSILNDYTDHCPIYINIKLVQSINSRVKIKFRDFSEFNVQKYTDEL